MAQVTVTGEPASALLGLLMVDSIQPGSAPSYQTCKTIYRYHPLGKRLAERPIVAAQSKPRKITVAGAPPEIAEQFNKQWKADGCTKHIRSFGAQARVYGICSLGVLTAGQDPNEPLDFKTLADAKIAYNVFDPLNTAGSLVLNQDPNSLDFQKTTTISVQGQCYARNRTCVLLNEEPIYIEYTSSGFGYVGVSVYQRPLYSLQSYIQTLITDRMIVLKAGVLVAKVRSAGSVVDQTMALLQGIKRAFVKEAKTGNVISIEPEESIESLNLLNLQQPYSLARANIIVDIASGADMPAIMINQDTFAEGFGEGSEDAQYVRDYIGTVRDWLQPAYDFCDRVTMWRAWNPEFYQTMQKKFPEQYGSVPYEQALYGWINAFAAEWPNLNEEPESEAIKVEAVKMQAFIDLLVTLFPLVDPDSQLDVLRTTLANLNTLENIFTTKYDVDFDLVLEHLVDRAAREAAAPEGEEEGESGDMKPPNPVKKITVGDSAIALLSKASRRIRGGSERADLIRQLRDAA